MIALGGISLDGLLFTDLEIIGTLLYPEFPSTIVYSNKQGDPFILEWLDCDSGDLNRYMLFRTDVELLNKFVSGRYSHKEFIKTSVREYVTVFDGTIKAPLNVHLLTFEQVPAEYLPEADVFFDRDDSFELTKVVEYFSLNTYRVSYDDFIPQVAEPNQQTITLKGRKDHETAKYGNIEQLAEEHSTQVFNIHLQEGNNVQHGVAETSVLGHIITTFDALYKATALDVFQGKNRGNTKTFTSKKAKMLLPRISTEIFLQRAASFSVFLRPLIHGRQLTITDDLDTEQISKHLFNLLTNTQELQTLASTLFEYSSFVQKSYIEFLTTIKEKDVNVDYNYYSPYNKKRYKLDFNPEKAWSLLDSINKLTDFDSDEFSRIVRFVSLNCNTGHFSCEAKDKQLYYGHFDSLLRENMPNLNFTTIYEIKIRRTIKNISGREAPKTEDTILSCLPKDLIV